MIAGRVLGIIVGMGPAATADFFSELVRRTDAAKDWDHLHVIIDNDVTIPSRTRALLYGEESPVNAMIRSGKKLAAAGCDFIAVPCNSAHYFYPDVAPALEIPWIDMVETVSAHLAGYRRVLIMGAFVTVTRRVYDRFLPQACYMEKEDNDLAVELIEKLKTGSPHESEKERLLSRIATKYSSIDCLLLACSELPMAFSEGKRAGYTIVSANRVYIERLIRIGKGLEEPRRSS